MVTSQDVLLYWCNSWTKTKLNQKELQTSPKTYLRYMPGEKKRQNRINDKYIKVLKRYLKMFFVFTQNIC